MFNSMVAFYEKNFAYCFAIRMSRDSVVRGRFIRQSVHLLLVHITLFLGGGVITSLLEQLFATLPQPNVPMSSSVYYFK